MVGVIRITALPNMHKAAPNARCQLVPADYKHPRERCWKTLWQLSCTSQSKALNSIHHPQALAPPDIPKAQLLKPSLLHPLGILEPLPWIEVVMACSLAGTRKPEERKAQANGPGIKGFSIWMNGFWHVSLWFRF